MTGGPQGAEPDRFWWWLLAVLLVLLASIVPLVLLTSP